MIIIPIPKRNPRFIKFLNVIPFLAFSYVKALPAISNQTPKIKLYGSAFFWKIEVRKNIAPIAAITA